jgi:N utilization substance protein A
MVIVDESNKSMEVVVPDDQLSLAIGRRGQNVRLASKISGWNLDVTSETDYNRVLKEAYNSLLSLDGIGEATATNLYQGGFRSVEDVAKSNIDELIQVKGISDEKAKKLIENATRYIESREIDKDTEEEPKDEK